MMSRQRNTQFMTYGLQVQWAEGRSSEAAAAGVKRTWRDVRCQEVTRIYQKHCDQCAHDGPTLYHKVPCPRLGIMTHVDPRCFLWSVLLCDLAPLKCVLLINGS